MDAIREATSAHVTTIGKLRMNAPVLLLISNKGK